MSLLKFLTHAGARQVIGIHLLALAVVASLGSAAQYVAEPRTQVASMVLAACFLTGLTLTLIHALRKLVQWDIRLSEIAAQPGEKLRLGSVAHSTKADFGWNRLAMEAERWNALSEVEASLRQALTLGEDRSVLQMLDALADGVVRVDSRGIIQYANAMMAALCGVRTAQELTGRNLAEAVRDPSLTDKLDAQPHLPHSVIEWSQPDGDRVRKLRGTRRIIGSHTSDASIEYVWTIRDVTQQRLADAMRDQFLSAATHEFRTPLANIRAYAESLDMGQDIDPESRKRFYNVIQSESLRLSQLVDDLLDISRMQAGALVLEERETDLERLVREAAAKVQGQMEERSLQFLCELPPKFPKAYVDKNKLIAALVNLLGNAAKYTPDGGRVTFRVDIDRGKLQFSISDTGIGIAPDELPKIFDRFFRSCDDRVREITGSGLGLALAQEVARLHGGELIAESVLDEGSTFRLSIPLHSAA